jgi:heavy metal sensor kinase
MRPFHSIRWTLQLWHAGILLLALLTFGAAAYFGVSWARYRGIDAELGATAQVVLSRLRMPPPRPLGGPPAARRGDFQGLDGPPPPEGRGGPEADPFRPPPEGREGQPPPFDRRPRPGDPRRPGNGGPPPEFRPGQPRPGDPENRRPDVPPDLIRRPGENEADQPYFIVWSRQGNVLHASTNRPPDIAFGPASAVVSDAVDQQRGGNSGRPAPPALVSRYRQRQDLREILLPGPPGTVVLVGRSVAREQNELRTLLWILLGTGATVMVVGLAGGWALSSRAVRPIRVISGAASDIADRADFARRIDLADTESELGELASTLNDAFARLEGAYRQQARFTADASHELRTPLSVMHSHLELALSRERSGEEYRQSISTCLRAAQRMRSLVESLLVLARADAGRLEMAREPLDLAEVARESMTLLAPLAEAKQVRIEADLTPTCVRGDRTRLAQVVTNLVTNAIHYNRDAGHVRVTVAPDDVGHVTLAVADTGIGVAGEDQPHLFERFFRADPSRSRAAGGSGLGLAICKSVVEAHGGTITYTSAPDQGSTFIVQFPSESASLGQKALLLAQETDSCRAAATGTPE